MCKNLLYVRAYWPYRLGFPAVASRTTVITILVHDKNDNPPRFVFPPYPGLTGGVSDRRLRDHYFGAIAADAEPFSEVMDITVCLNCKYEGWMVLVMGWGWGKLRCWYFLFYYVVSYYVANNGKFFCGPLPSITLQQNRGLKHHSFNFKRLDSFTLHLYFPNNSEITNKNLPY